MPNLCIHLLCEGQLLAEIPFSADRLQVGRLEENDVVVPDRAASRTHALLERDGEQVFVLDLGSQNGIWLGERRIAGRTPIGPEDELRIGSHRLRVVPSACALAEDDEEERDGDGVATVMMRPPEAPSGVTDLEPAGLEPFSIREEDLAGPDDPSPVADEHVIEAGEADLFGAPQVFSSEFDEPMADAVEADAEEAKELELVPVFEEVRSEPWVLELEVDPASLPEPLRRAVDELDEPGELRLSVVLRRRGA